MDGYAATRLLEATVATARIPLYLAKPLDPAALGVELRRFLSA
jgi:hypothetical protein